MRNIQTNPKSLYSHTGGIMLPEQSQGKVASGTVIAVGPGLRSKTGDLIPTQVKEGDKVLLPEYGGQKVKVDDKELFLFKDTELLGKWVD